MAQVNKLTTADGHSAKIVLRNKYLRLFSSQYWLHIFSKKDHKHIICSRCFYSEQDAINTANIFTLDNYIKELQQ